MSEILSEISAMIIDGNFREMGDKTNAAIAEGIEAKTILNEGLMSGLSLKPAISSSLKCSDQQNPCRKR